MKDISFYLVKYSKIGLKEEIIEKCLIESISDTCGILVDKKMLKITPKNINLDIQGPKKTEIFIKTKEIQEKFDKKIQKRGIKLDKKRMF